VGTTTSTEKESDMSYNHLYLLSGKRKLNLDDLMDRHTAMIRGEFDSLEPPPKQKTIEPPRIQRMVHYSLPPPSTPCPDCKSPKTVITKKGLMCAKCGYGIEVRRAPVKPVTKSTYCQCGSSKIVVTASHVNCSACGRSIKRFLNR
jgi:hypothetical protein